MNVGWFFVLVAGLFEVGYAYSLRHLDWSLRIAPLAGFAICGLGSLTFLLLAIRTVPLGTAYAVWTGLGVAGTAALGIALHEEPVSIVRLMLLTILLCSVCGLLLTAEQ